MTNKQIATTIWEQMRALDLNLCMCMGVQKLTVIENGLEFTVNGLSFKGKVQITLNGKDLYDVKLVKPTRKQNQTLKEAGIKSFDIVNKPVAEFNDVFVEDLMPLLEDQVENRKGA